MKTVTIENMKPRLHHIGKDISLAPGENVIPAAAWQEARANRIVRLHLEARDLVEKDVSALRELEPLPTELNERGAIAVYNGVEVPTIEQVTASGYSLENAKLIVAQQFAKALATVAPKEAPVVEPVADPIAPPQESSPTDEKPVEAKLEELPAEKPVDKKGKR
jgi:hypothetical protein